MTPARIKDLYFRCYSPLCFFQCALLTSVLSSLCQHRKHLHISIDYSFIQSTYRHLLFNVSLPLETFCKIDTYIDFSLKISILPLLQSTRQDTSPSLQSRITQQICKNILLISCQKWQQPSLTSASHIRFFLFHFHFSFPAVHLRYKYSLTAPPLCSQPSFQPSKWPH